MSFRFNQGDRPLPGYTIQRGVGRGGFGEVYYATSDGGKEIALKYLRENPQVELRGAQHCLNLKSPYLVDLHDIRENASGEFFVIMEFVHGPSLRDMMNNEPRGLGPQKAAYLVREIGKGLAYLHDRGIVHRDLKPGNIFYEDGYVKIGDYGLSKIMAASQHSGQTISVGTVHYMAPEVGSGNYDKTIDIYALGVILYEMVLGRVPFSGSSMGEVLMKHLTAQPAVDELPEPFPKVIRKALAKDPAERYQTVQEMVADLFSVEDLDKSVAALEPATLSMAAARAARDLNLKKSPVAVGGPDFGPLGTGSSNVGAPLPPPVIRPELLADRRGAAADVERGVAIDGGGSPLGWADRVGRHVVGASVDPNADAGVSEKPSTRSVVERVIVTALVLVGISLGAGALVAADNPAMSAVVFLNSCAMVMGVLVGGWLSFEKLRLTDKWMPRLLIAGLAAPALLPSVAFLDQTHYGRGSPLSPVAVLVAALLLMDWPKRVALARQGELSIKAAFLAGLFGFIGGNIVGRHGEMATVLAATCAAASLAVQALARLRMHGAAASPVNAVTGAMAGMGGRRAGLNAHAPGPAVAVELGSAPPSESTPQRRVAATVPPVVTPHASNDGTAPDRKARGATVRMLWLLAAAVFIALAIVLFCFPNLSVRDVIDENGRVISQVSTLHPDEETGFIISGIGALALGLFSFTRFVPRYQTDYWRGVARPFLFFIGAALAAGAGTALGNMTRLNGEEKAALLGLILFGAIVALFVWLVPASLFVSPPGTENAAALNHADQRRKSGRRLVTMGIAGLCLGIALMVILLATVRESDWDEVLPATLIPIGLISSTMMGVGFYKMRTGRPKPVEVTLPLRRKFEVAANPNLPKLIERHMAMLGYTLSSRSDLLWQFSRGNFVAQFWNSDIRQWAIRASIAAYELDNGGYRVTCFVDQDRAFNSPTREMKTLLDAEFRDLMQLLDGRELPADSTGGIVR